MLLADVLLQPVVEIATVPCWVELNAIVARS